MSFIRSKNVKAPQLPEPPEIPKEDATSAQVVARAFTAVEEKALAFRETLDPYAGDRERLESQRAGMKDRYFADQLHATMTKHAPQIAAARRELRAAHTALLEVVAEHTDIARRETLALMAAPDKIAITERLLGMVRPSELVFTAQRAVRDGDLIAGAVLRRLIEADTMPAKIREAVTDALSHMGAGLTAFAQQVVATAQQHRAQASILESYASSWPADPDASAMLKAANGDTEHDLVPPFDRAIERARTSLDPKTLITTANAV